MNNNYKNYIKNYNLIINQSDDASIPQEAPKKESSSLYDNITKNILPILLGLSAVSLFFGQGIFGIGKTNKRGENGIFGGWLGQTIGGLGLVTLLPSLWSKKDLSTRLKAAFDKLSEGKILEAISEFFGISSSADDVLKKGKSEAQSVSAQKTAIQERRSKYISASQDTEKIRAWMKRNDYDIDQKIQLTENISCFGVIPRYDVQINALKTNKKVVCFLVNSSNGYQVSLNKVSEITNFIDAGYINSIKIAFTAGKKEADAGKPDPTKNQFRQVNYTEGINALYLLKNSSTSTDEWLSAVKIIANKLQQATKNSITITNKLFDGLQQTVKSGYLIDIPSDLNSIVDQQTEISVAQIAKDIANDDALKNAKDEDLFLNKFDKGIEAAEYKIENIYINVLLDSLNAANENDPTGFIIRCISGSNVLYYARDPEHNYLTDSIKNTVYFTKAEVEKLDGSGDLAIKLQKTLEKIHLPQVMKVKTPGLKVEIKKVNIQYSNKFSEVMTKLGVNFNS